jgi:3-phenylpropionate/cinnamic acid dioxygenase small subunit
MPIRRTRLRRERHREFTEPGEMAYFDDDKMMLLARATKYLSGSSWSEDPPSRSRHLITNVRVVGSEGDEISTSSNFHVYRSRYRGETDSWVGRREDVLRRDADSFVIARRTIYLDQTVLQSANLTTLF